MLFLLLLLLLLLGQTTKVMTMFGREGGRDMRKNQIRKRKRKTRYECAHHSKEGENPLIIKPFLFI